MMEQRFYRTLAGIALAAVALAGGLVPHSAQASHFGTLEVTPDTATAESDADHLRVLTAKLDRPVPLGSPGPRILFETESGPNDREGDSPTAPDASCNVVSGTDSCSVSYTGGGSGVDRIRAWIDEDGQISIVESDRSEGRYSGPTDCLPADGDACSAGQAEPGDVAEPDGTDLVEVIWEIRRPFNTPPSASVALDSDSPRTNDTLTATVSDVSDPDNDAVTFTYVWKVNGETVQTTSATSSTTDTLDLSEPGNGDRGDTITVEMTPNDGTDDGATATDSAKIRGNRPG